MNKVLYFWDAFLTSIIRLPRFTLSRPVRLISLGKRVSIKDQILFFKRLSMMLRAQMPIVTALTMLKNEISIGPLTSITTSLLVKISSGQTLSTALSHYKKTFGNFSLSIIAVGERSGTLPESLEYIAIELKKKQEIRKQILGALIYPTIVVLATLAITIFLIVYIFPKIVPIFLSVETTLPWSTQFLINVSNFLQLYGWYVAGVVVMGFILVPILLKIKRIQHYYTRALLRIPLIGLLCRYYNLAQISRTLGLLLVNDIPIVTSLDITANSIHNCIYTEALTHARAEIIMGKNLSGELKNYPLLFPALFIQMIQAGETTGTMPVTLTYVSEIYESDIKDITKNLTTILEPLLMLFMGLMVGFIAISIITPIYGITQNLHQ
ncbi:MAG: type II secretion system F family protein [Patescibacteria group bacterium]